MRGQPRFTPLVPTTIYDVVAWKALGRHGWTRPTCCYLPGTASAASSANHVPVFKFKFVGSLPSLSTTSRITFGMTRRPLRHARWYVGSGCSLLHTTCSGSSLSWTKPAACTSTSSRCCYILAASGRLVSAYASCICRAFLLGTLRRN